jgi:hypothetical protein
MVSPDSPRSGQVRACLSADTICSTGSRIFFTANFLPASAQFAEKLTARMILFRPWLTFTPDLSSTESEALVVKAEHNGGRETAIFLSESPLPDRTSCDSG